MVAKRKKLIDLRNSTGLSQTQFSSKIGISRSYYSNIERGVCNPSIDVAKAISEKFNTSIESIFFAE